MSSLASLRVDINLHLIYGVTEMATEKKNLKMTNLEPRLKETYLLRNSYSLCKGIPRKYLVTKKYVDFKVSGQYHSSYLNSHDRTKASAGSSIFMCGLVSVHIVDVIVKSSKTARW